MQSFCSDGAPGGWGPGVGQWASVRHSEPSGKWAGSLLLRDLLRGLTEIISVKKYCFLSPLSGNLGPWAWVMVSGGTLQPCLKAVHPERWANWSNWVPESPIVTWARKTPCCMKALRSGVCSLRQCRLACFSDTQGRCLEWSGRRGF